MKASTILRSSGVLIRHPRGLLSARPAYLMMLSHMRSYSSLLGHILGSHPEIIGHRERHRSYEHAYQLLLFRYHMFLDNRRVGSGYLFDKLLHDHCRLSDKILARDDVRVFVVLRRPEATLKSILRMGKRNGETRGFGDPAWVLDYYRGRLNQIVADAQRVASPIGILHAEDILERTDEVLAALTRWLGLRSPLKNDYNIFPDTGARGRGDASARIHAGKVIPRADHDDEDVALDPAMLDAAQATYEACRGSLLRHAAGGSATVFAR